MSPLLFRFGFLFLTLLSLGTARADVIISEFLANNNTGLADEDGERGDWIELYNDGTSIVNLNGWRLTDELGNLTKWTLPAVTLEPKGFLLVFASNKDRTNPAGVLHTNFKLSASGGYLALVRANGTLATEFNLYPAQYDDRPYGFGQSVSSTTLIAPGAAVQYLVPTSSTPNNATWTARTFVDTSWTSGTSALGFEATVPGWAFKTYFSNGGIPNLTQAEAVIVTPALQTSVQQTNHPVINFNNSDSQGHYSPENAPSWLTSGAVDNYVVEGTGTITVPASGLWTFCISSDDGCSLQIRSVGGSYTTVASFTGLRAMGDSIGTYNFPTAGQYEIRIVVFENGGGSGGEVSARQGSVGAWDASFRLIGDTAGGGLAVQSLPVGTGGGYGAFISTNVKAAMFDAAPQKSSCYVRYKFTDPGALASLSLPVRYDDGIAVYLNGALVASRLAPGALTNTSVATGDHPQFLSRQKETIDLTPFIGSLVAGTNANVVAIHALNESASNGDFLIGAELYQYAVTVTPTANFYTTATPGVFNTSAIYNKVAPVVASVERGFYSTAQSIALTTGTVGATIRYTFDGSTPVETVGSSATYAGPIAINGTRTLRYRAFKAGSDPSDVVTQTYIFTSDVITQQPTGTPPTIANPTGATQATTTWPGAFDAGTGKYKINEQELDFGMDPDVVNNPTYSGTIQNDLKAIPTFSIVTDLPNLFDPATGIYVNSYEDTIAWERAASVELINPDGTPGFQVNCGLRLRGGFSRHPSNPKHAFRLFFRDTYGPAQLSYPLFGNDPTGTDEFDKFDLRCSQNYSWSFGGDPSGTGVADILARDQQLAMGHPSSHGNPYHLYVNGQYWGLFEIDERPDANFGATYFGGTDTNFDTVKVDPDINYNIEATDGNLDAWFSLWQLADGGLAAGNSEEVNNTTYQRLIGRNPDGTVNGAYPVLFDAINTIDSALIIYWGGNLDAQISNFLSNQSPNNSFTLRDRTGASGGFKSVLHDSEHTLRNVNENRLGPWPAGSSTAPNGGGFNKSTPQYVFQQCMSALEFRTLAADRIYKHCFNNGVLTPTTALAMFDARTAEIDRAVVPESARWGDSKTATPFTRNDWVNACNSVRTSFLPLRTTNLLAQLRTLGWYPSFDPPVFSQRGGSVIAGTSITLTFAPGTPGGSTLHYTIDGSDPRAMGGGVGPTASSIPSGGSVVINTSQLIRVRTKNGTTWSALDEAAFYVTQDFSPLAITEVHYNPLPSTVGGIDATEHEFIEFKNTGTSTLDVGGLTFSTGLTFTFPLGTSLAPGAFYVLVRNATKFAARYPGVTIGGVFGGGSLDNGGESLTLVTPAGGAVLTVNYDDDPPWPAAADGNGFSIVPNGTNYNSDKGSNWRASANVHGSPRADDPAVSFAAIKINEALTNSLAPLKDTIELYNPTGGLVVVGDWWLTDDRNVPKKYRIPPGTAIPAGQHISFDETQFNPTPGVGTSFALGGTGDDVYLFSGNAAGDLTGYSHGWDFAAAEQNVSFGRHVNSVGDEYFPRQTTLTFNGANAGPDIGPIVINEVMYNPYSGYDEYIEIYNPTPAPVSLDGPAGTTWRVAGINYNFPAGQSIPANGYALVVGIDPATFRALYGIPGSVPIFGPYSGVLQNSGERLSLEQPDTPYIDQGQTIVPYIVIDAVRYNDKAPWPIAADGNGPSLQRLSASAFADDPVNWFASGATPGAANNTNFSPSISLTGPPEGATFTTPVNITFTANANDSDGSVAKVEFYIDGAKVGEDSSAPFSYIWAGTGGVHICTAVAIDNALGTTTSTPVTIYVTTPVTQGLKGQYFVGAENFASGPAGVRIDSTVNFSIGQNWPANTGIPGIANTGYSVRWTGQLRPPTTGSYTLYIKSDDGSFLYLDDALVISNGGYHGDIELGYTVNLTGGELYKIRMDMFQGSGGATAVLSWSGPGVGKQVIPQARLYPDSSPIIITSPNSRTAEAGGNTTFTVFASGLNNHFQWRKGGVAIPGATGASFMIQELLTSEAGVYSCLVTNAHGFAVSANATLTVTFTDSDSDGMQNSWETLYGLNPNSGADAALDKDGDGESNLDEFRAGTNPTNPNDVLRPILSKIVGGWKITFTAQSRKSYTVQYKNALNAAAWTNLQTASEQLGVRTIEITDTSVGAENTRFYRIVTPSQ